MSMMALARNTGYAFGENRLTLIAVIILALLAFCALFGSSIAPFDPLTTNAALKLARPSALHPFGTDSSGYDGYAQVMRGTQTSLKIAIMIALGSTLLGAIWGAVAGFYRGIVDAVVVGAGAMIREVLILAAIPATIRVHDEVDAAARDLERERRVARDAVVLGLTRLVRAPVHRGLLGRAVDLELVLAAFRRRPRLLRAGDAAAFIDWPKYTARTKGALFTSSCHVAESSA